MGILHANLEGKVQEEYGFKEVVKKPLKSAWNEIFQDVKNHQSKTGGMINAALHVVLEHCQNSTRD